MLTVTYKPVMSVVMLSVVAPPKMPNSLLFLLLSPSYWHHDIRQNDSRHNDTRHSRYIYQVSLFVHMLGEVILNVVMLSVLAPTLLHSFLKLSLWLFSFSFTYSPPFPSFYIASLFHCISFFHPLFYSVSLFLFLTASHFFSPTIYVSNIYLINCFPLYCYLFVTLSLCLLILLSSPSLSLSLSLSVSLSLSIYLFFFLSIFLPVCLSIAYLFFVVPPNLCFSFFNYFPTFSLIFTLNFFLLITLYVFHFLTLSHSVWHLPIFHYFSFQTKITFFPENKTPRFIFFSQIFCSLQCQGPSVTKLFIAVISKLS